MIIMSSYKSLDDIKNRINHFNKQHSDHAIITFNILPPLKCRICSKYHDIDSNEFSIIYGVDGCNGYECKKECK